MEVVSTSTGAAGCRAFSSLTTVWQRTKSPIHMYGTSRIGALSAVAGDLTSTTGKSLEWEFILVLN